MNNKILKQRWEKVDELLSAFFTKNKKINRRMYDNIQSILDGIKFSYEELDNYASMSDIARLRGRIEDIKEEYGLSGYPGYQLNSYSSRKKLKNRELLYAYLLIEYYRQQQEQKVEEDKLFDEVCTMTYKSVSEETYQVLHKKKPKKIEEPKAWLLGLILNMGYNGFAWLFNKEGTLMYNTKNMYEVILILIQQNKPLKTSTYEIDKLIKKQEKAYLNKNEKEKTYEDYKNDFSGSLDNQIAFLVNQVALKGMKDQGCKKVQFIAVMDEKTTTMCKTLDRQIFDIYEKNIYSRYSAEDKKNIIYETNGLETGANLPPINNHFHYCRSTIYPYK